jgi:hypothetical protein
MTTIKMSGLVLALMLLPACASGIEARTASHLHSCEVSSLDSVFAEPLRFDGKVFCGTAVIVVSPYVGFFTRAGVDADEDIALIPRGDRRRILGLVPLGSGKRVYLRGRCERDWPQHAP